MLENSTNCDTILGEVNQSANDQSQQEMDELSTHFVSKAKILCVEQSSDFGQNVNAEVDLDLQKIIADKQLYLGKDGFDKNLNKVKGKFCKVLAFIQNRLYILFHAYVCILKNTTFS